MESGQGEPIVQVNWISEHMLKQALALLFTLAGALILTVCAIAWTTYTTSVSNLNAIQRNAEAITKLTNIVEHSMPRSELESRLGTLKSQITDNKTEIDRLRTWMYKYTPSSPRG